MIKKYEVLYFGTIAVFLFIQGCAMITITTSDRRNPVPQTILLKDNIKLTTWGAIKINKSHFFPSSFRINFKEKVIYIDPIEIDATEKADFIFLTHSHPDHFSIRDIEKIHKAETGIICPKGLMKKLSPYASQIKMVTPGDVLDLGDMTCQAIPAYNTKRVFLWIKAHPISKKNVGFLFDFAGIRIYHAGDTDYIPEMKIVKNIDVALVPIGGDNLTMNIEEAARLTNEIKPDLVIPMHYEIDKTGDLIGFRMLIDPEIRVEILQ